MKKLLLLFVITYLSNSLSAQTTPTIDTAQLNPFIRAYIEKENKMKNKYVTTTSFNNLIQGVFSKVVVKSDDIVKNGTATSLKIDDDKSTLSGNINIKAFKNSFFNIGLAGTSKGKTLSIFDANAYSKGFTISTGLDIRLCSSIWYANDSADTLKHSREVSNLIELGKIKKTLLLDTTILNNNIKSLEKELEFSDAISLNSLDIDFKEKDSLLQLCKAQLANRKALIETINKKEFEAYVEKKMSAFELERVKSISYSLHWLSLTPSFTNNSYNLFDTSIAAILQKDTLKKDYYRQYSFSASYNYLKNVPNKLLYGYIGFIGKNSFALEDISLKNGGLYNASKKLIEVNGEQLLDISKVTNSYNKGYFSFTVEAGGFIFFGAKKSFGFEAYASATTKSNVPDGIEYRPSYNFRLGPLFSLSKDGGFLSSGTIGLMMTATNYYPNQTFGDIVSFGVRLGLPFNNIKL